MMPVDVNFGFPRGLRSQGRLHMRSRVNGYNIGRIVESLARANGNHLDPLNISHNTCGPFTSALKPTSMTGTSTTGTLIYYATSGAPTFGLSLPKNVIKEVVYDQEVSDEIAARLAKVVLNDIHFSPSID